MKIGIDCRLWNETGVGRYIRNLVKELAEIDKENEYVLFLSKRDVTDVKHTIRNSEFTTIPTDIHWHSLSEQIQFTKILNNERLDLLHFPYFSHPITYRKPFVITIHDLIISHFATGKATTLPLPLYYAKRFAFQRVLDHGIQRSRRIIVPLNAVKADIRETFFVPEKKIAVTYEGFNIPVPDNKQGIVTKKGNYFLYVGNAYPHKNVEGLLMGFQEYKKRVDNDMQLYLVGKEDYFYQRIERSVSKEQKEHIQFLHGISDKQLTDLYQHARALVSASKMEGFGLPPLEAMALGTPVLVSDIPSFREVCGDAALYFNPNDSQDIARMMNVIVNTSSNEMTKRLHDGLQRAKQFSWKRMAEETLDVYREAEA